MIVFFIKIKVYQIIKEGLYVYSIVLKYINYVFD